MDKSVLLVNGSPRQFGCTHRALVEISNELSNYGVESKILWLGTDVKHCRNCRNCKGKQIPCHLRGDKFGELHDDIIHHSAVIFGSPVYYGGITSQLKAMLTRLFYSCPKLMERKPVAGVFSSRRAGSTSAMSELNLFFSMHSCTIVGSQYWNEVHGDTPKEVELDIEGLQTMRTLARNFATILLGTNIELERKVHMNFISREYLKLLKEQS